MRDVHVSEENGWLPPCSESLLHGNETADESGRSVDWLGRPADNRNELGGWACSLTALGAFGLVYTAFYGIVGNLVLYLVNVLSETNAEAANNVNYLMGTLFLSSFIGAFLSDAYMGRLWGSIAFEILSVVSFGLCSSAAMLMTGNGSACAGSGTWLFCSLYLMVVACGSAFPSLSSLGADQLRSHDEKARFFTMFAMTISVGQILATTGITYLDNQELWAWSFWLCTGAAAAGLTLSLCAARKCRQYRVGGNPLVRVAQVVVAASRNRKHKGSGLLHEVKGKFSAIPGCRKLPHTNTFRYLDKAASLGEEEEPSPSPSPSPWRVCTVTQVEEVKCVLRVLPVGLACACVQVAAAQINTLFIEQAALMNQRVVGGLTIAPASMQLFHTGGALLMGFLYDACCVRLLHGYATSLHMQGLAMVVSIISMVLAALVEAHRLRIAHEGYLVSILWLIPQFFLLGISTNLVYAGSLDFFYNEVSDGMRTISTSISLLFLGSGNYLSSIFIILITTLTTQGGQSGWIPTDLNDGHVDYFYWFIACFLTCAFALYATYAHFYTYITNRYQDL